MNWKNTFKGYGVVARWFHIILAFMIIGQLAVGMYMVSLPNNLKASIYADHKMYGLIALVLVLFRLSWRVFNVLPKLPEDTPNWQVFAARSLHRVFYVFMIGMPISGWMMSTAAGYLPKFPGLGKVAFPFFQQMGFCIVGSCMAAKSVGSLMHEIHEIMGFLFIALIVTHTTVGIYHFYLKDGILERMFIDKT